MAAGGVVGGDDQGVVAGAQTAEGHVVVHVGQIIVGGVGLGAGGIQGLSGAVADLRVDVGDGIGAAQRAPEGEAGGAHLESVGVGGIGGAGQGPVGGAGDQLPGGGGVTGGDLAAGGEAAGGEILAGAPVLQGEAAAVPDQGPQLIALGGGGGCGDRALPGGEAQGAVGVGDGVVAAGVVDQIELLVGAALALVDGEAGALSAHGQIGVGVGADEIAALAQRRVVVAVLGQHGLGLGGLVDPQPDVYAQLDVGGAAGVVGQGVALHAVAAGQSAAHLGGGVGGQPSALGVDGVDQLALGLVGKAAHGVEGPLADVGGAVGAVLHGPGPDHVPQGDAVVGDVEGGDLVLQRVDADVVVFRPHEVPLGPAEAVGVLLRQALPRGVKPGAVAGGAVVIGLAEGVADAAVVGVGGFLAPLEEGPGRSGAGGEHIHAVGLAAGIAGGLGDGAGIAVGFVLGAQLAQHPLLQIVRRRGPRQRQQHRGQKCQQHAQAQNDRWNFTRIFHRITCSVKSGQFT